MEILTFLKDYNGIIVGLLAILFWLWKGQEKSDDNAEAITKLEKSINQLVDEIKVLVTQNNGINIKIENHEVRLNSVEKRTEELQLIKYQLK